METDTGLWAIWGLASLSSMRQSHCLVSRRSTEQSQRPHLPITSAAGEISLGAELHWWDLTSYTHFLMCSRSFRATDSQRKQDGAHRKSQRHCKLAHAPGWPGSVLPRKGGQQSRGSRRERERENKEENWKAPELYLGHLILDRASASSPYTYTPRRSVSSENTARLYF